MTPKTVWRSVYKVLIMSKEKQLFYLKASHDLSVVDSSLAKQDVVCLKSFLSEPGIEPQREILIKQDGHADLTAGGKCWAT